jgi:hypothetical protein
MPSGDSWSAEQVQLLRTLWSQGETSAVIAARLGGPSRSAVLGKIFRLRLRAEAATAAVGKRQRAAGTDGASAGVPARRRRRPRSNQTPPPQPVRQHVTLLELTNTTCRPANCSGEPKKIGKSATAGMPRPGRQSPR